MLIRSTWWRQCGECSASVGGQRHRGAMAEASTDPREGPCGLAVPPFLRSNGIAGFTLQENHLLVPVEEGLKQRLVNQEHFTETHPGEERLPRAVEGGRHVYEAK